MVTVVCVLYGCEQYGPSWVNKLYRGVKRNSCVSFRFLCLTDCDNFDGRFDHGIEVEMLEDETEGWMNINEIFRPYLGIDRGVFMGLDTIITGDITHILEWRGDFGLVHSPMAPSCCNAVVCFGRKWAELAITVTIRVPITFAVSRVDA